LLGFGVHCRCKVEVREGLTQLSTPRRHVASCVVQLFGVPCSPPTHPTQHRLSNSCSLQWTTSRRKSLGSGSATPVPRHPCRKISSRLDSLPLVPHVYQKWTCGTGPFRTHGGNLSASLCTTSLRAKSHAVGASGSVFRGACRQKCDGVSSFALAVRALSFVVHPLAGCVRKSKHHGGWFEGVSPTNTLCSACFKLCIEFTTCVAIGCAPCPLQTSLLRTVQ